MIAGVRRFNWLLVFCFCRNYVCCVVREATDLTGPVKIPGQMSQSNLWAESGPYTKLTAKSILYSFVVFILFFIYLVFCCYCYHV